LLWNSIENMKKNLRTEMPATAAIIDDLRAAFGAEVIEPAIRSGMAGVPLFYARENGREIGTRCAQRGTEINSAQMVIEKPKPPVQEQRR